MIDNSLSQDEIDSLLEGLTGEKQKDNKSNENKSLIKDYDLSSQERIVRGRMPTLEIINERFSRNFRVGLFNYTRKNSEVMVNVIKVQRYSSFLRELTVPTNFNIVKIRPLRGNGIIVCEPTIIFGIIDTLYGGTGKLKTRIEGREFSITEQKIITNLVNVITEEYKKSWNGIYPIELIYQRSEMLPQFANIAAPGEIIVSTSFQLEIGDFSGLIHICIPYATLEPIRDILYSSTQGDNNETDKRWVNVLKTEIQEAKVTLVAELSKVDTNIEQILSIKPGDFIELKRENLIKATISDVPVFECNYGVNNNKYAIKINKFLNSSTQLNWLEEHYE